MKKKFELYFFLGLLIFLSIVFFRLLLIFWVPILMAILTAHYFYKPYCFLLQRTKMSKSMASLLVTLLVGLLVFIPLTIISLLLSLQAAESYVTLRDNWKNFYQLFERIRIDDLALKWFPALSEYRDEIAKLDIQSRVVGFVETTFNWVFRLVRQTFLNVSIVITNFFIVLYLVYFLLIEGDKLMKKVTALIPLPSKEKDHFIKTCILTTDATIVGTVFISLAEGIFGGFLLWALGIPSAIFIGVIIAFIAMLPVLGTNTVFGLVAIYKFIVGDWVSGLILLLVGMPMIILSQNVIKPKVVGDRSGIHPGFIVISTFGGIVWLGIMGILVGPLIASLFIAIWKLFERRYYSEDSIENEGGGSSREPPSVSRTQQVGSN